LTIPCGFSRCHNGPFPVKKHAFQGKLFLLREENVVFQPGLCIYPKTQYYPFIHHNCYSLLYLLDTIRTKTILVQCFPDCHSRHIDGGTKPARILFCYSNEVSLSFHSKFYSICDPNVCHPVVFTTNKSAASAKYSLNVTYSFFLSLSLTVVAVGPVSAVS